MYKHFKHIEEDLQAENMLKAKSRQPRAPLDIVGNIASSLFGVLDSTYADKMVQAITKVKANEKHLLTLLRNQTSLIDSTINVIKRDEISSCKRLKKIENYIAESTGTECRFIKLSRYITLATQLSLLASSLPRMQTEIINVLAHIRRNTISPILVTPTLNRNNCSNWDSNLNLHHRSQFDQPKVYLSSTVNKATKRRQIQPL